MPGKYTIFERIRKWRDVTWKKQAIKDPENIRFGKKFADRTWDLIMKSLKAVGQEAEETEQMARSFFRILESKLNLNERSEPPTEEEVKEAIEQLKDVGRFSLFTTVSILPGGAVSLIGLELLARRFGVKGFTLVPSSFQKKKKSAPEKPKTPQEKPEK